MPWIQKNGHSIFTFSHFIDLMYWDRIRGKTGSVCVCLSVCLQIDIDRYSLFSHSWTWKYNEQVGKCLSVAIRTDNTVYNLTYTHFIFMDVHIKVKLHRDYNYIKYDNHMEPIEKVHNSYAY